MKNIFSFNKKNSENITTYKLEDILNLNYTIKNKTILIFEPHSYHYECTPGYAKYFIDLGFKVDILMKNFGKDAFCLFENKEKIRLFLYYKLKKINFFAKNISLFMSYYSFILIQTISPKSIGTISELGLLNNEKAIYVFHYTKYYEVLNFSKIKNRNRIWTLANFLIGLKVVPYYIGNIKLKNKNKITRFFIVSTKNRNYNLLISAAEKLKDENLDFEVVVIGKVRKFSKKSIKKKIKQNFLFNYRVNFSTLYKNVESSDFIIINLSKNDTIFLNKKVTGAAQLSYGFGKPVLINKNFKSIYNLTNENSFIYSEKDFYDVMKKAILLNNKNYKIMQKNLFQLTKTIYNISFANIKKTFESVLNNQ